MLESEHSRKRAGNVKAFPTDREGDTARRRAAILATIDRIEKLHRTPRIVLRRIVRSVKFKPERDPFFHCELQWLADQVHIGATTAGYATRYLRAIGVLGRRVKPKKGGGRVCTCWFLRVVRINNLAIEGDVLLPYKPGKDLRATAEVNKHKRQLKLPPAPMVETTPERQPPSSEGEFVPWVKREDMRRAAQKRAKQGGPNANG